MHSISLTCLIEIKDNIICGIHPSPLARGFVGSNVFIEVEKKLNKTINWANG